LGKGKAVVNGTYRLLTITIARAIPNLGEKRYLYGFAVLFIDKDCIPSGPED
jgi:hypothetical protein